jgi:hypothetical protein
MWDESSDGPSALCYGTSISVIKVSQTQLDYELFYSTRCFGLSWLGHHQVVDILLRKLYNCTVSSTKISTTRWWPNQERPKHVVE